MNVLTEYILNNVRKIGKNDYKPTQKDIEMINRHYPENVRFRYNKAFIEFYDCELKPSKWSQFNEINAFIFMIDLTSYHRTVINPNTNNEINEMQLTLNNFERICGMKYQKNILCFHVFFFLCLKLCFFLFCFVWYFYISKALILGVSV